MNKVLVTGATGFIGSNLVKRLLKNNLEVHVVTRDRSHVEQSAISDSPVVIHQHDGTTAGMIEIFQAAQPEVVFHLAAKFVAEHESQDINELMDSNLLFGVQLLEAMAVTGVQQLVNTGTAWQHFEQEAYNPVNLYAATKQAFETLAAYYVRTGLLKMITLKLIDTYGPNDPRTKIFTLFKRISLSGERLNMSPGEQRLGLVYIDDVVDAFLIAGQYVEDLTDCEMLSYTVAPERLYSLREVAALYETISGKRMNIGWGERPYRSREVMEPYVGPTLPDWEAKVSLAEGIRKCLDA
ncbi:NAD-dependent epimerase/dehydratase [Desulfitobacterium hafniense DCB-2]|uniref:NAD-dependent epimerase/dehydratase n=1 Tax=Desulfitobacterium hafniense (strain DSM 10664 / DCB-2) TaxID=272564 RepID=B8FTU9_DESHD|nr:NAD-dependent epimerase/dehydratase family protein [Desulfitobacterium hafniense]ACL22191.1 NAD-dependent epimerase/dehydratase [Desulfitobacterium hafniense DCB-2]